MHKLKLLFQKKKTSFLPEAHVKPMRPCKIHFDINPNGIYLIFSGGFKAVTLRRGVGAVLPTHAFECLHTDLRLKL